VRYPGTWRGEQAEQDGVWYRYFVAPSGPGGKPAASATLLAGALSGDLDAYAQAYLKDNGPATAKDETRGPARGRSFAYASADGATRYLLLLLEDKGRVVGVYSQAPAATFEAQRPLLEAIAASLTLEDPQGWPEVKDDEFGFALRMPASWTMNRRFSGSGTLLMQFTSPALMVDKGRETVHGALTLSVEPLPGAGGVQSYYDATRLKLGDAFKIVSHEPWKNGLVDVMTTETPVSASRVKRFYAASGTRGYSLAFEAREDVFSRVSRWCDAIAATFSTR
jgi:hypothetical protein